MQFGKSLVFYCVIFTLCEGEISNHYLDAVPRKVFGNMGHKMCIKKCLWSGATLCKAYSFNHETFTCYLYVHDSTTATLMPGNDYWYEELSDISDNFLGTCSSVSCGNRERCVIMRNKQPRCVVSECTDPPTIPNGTVTPGLNAVKTVRPYICDIGYDLIGNGDVTCKANGQWTIPTFSCQLVNCGTPQSVNNADISAGPTTYGSTKTYTCHPGYDTSGTTSITCQADATWNALGITCTIQDCGAPSSVVRALAPSYTTTTYESIVTYTCETGYVLSGGTGQITCLAGPIWEIIVFGCLIQDCGVPLTLANAGIPAYTATTYMSVATYSCNTGYTLSTQFGDITCQDGPAWDTITFTCGLQDCGQPQTLANAIPAFTSTTYLSTATYTCDTGYTMNGGSGQITCQTGPAWDSIVFTCDIQDCGVPQTVANAANPSYTTTTYLSIATYTCDTGYSLSGGTGQITCQAGPAWDSISFSCDIQDCGVPQTITNAATPGYTTTTYLSTATYTCGTGYSLSGGTGQITCQAGPAWDTITFSCGMQDCGQPQTLANAAAPSYASTTYLSTATYSCLTGYSMNGGSGQITCQVGPAWDSISFTCDIQDCGVPETITNAASLSYTTTTYLNTATYTCNTGYSLSGGTGQITCQAGPVWDTITFSCDIQDCGFPQTIANAASPSYTTTTYLSSATYTCDSGYEMSGGPGQIACQDGPSWDTITFSCAGQDCGQPQTLANANPPSYTTTSYLSTVSYTCLTGYSMNGGSGQITCQPGPAWDPILFTCDIQDCGVPQTVTNAASPSYTTTTYLSTATYTCNTGYLLSGGTGQITCQAGSAWDTVTFTCNIQDCGTPQTISNAAAPSYTTTTYLSTATYTCDSGYEISGGTGVIACQNDGTWESITFSCGGQDCGTPPVVANTNAASYSTTAYQSVAVYTCVTGYLLNAGPAQVTCEAGGIWSSVGFTCDIQDCGTPQTVANAAAATYTATTYLSTAAYTCDSGYEMSGGTGVITCQNDGTWGSITFSCGGQDCGTPPAVANTNAASYTTTTYQSVASYTCVSGYSLNGGPAQVTCEAGGIWSSVGFTCVIQDCGTPPTVANTNAASYSTSTYQSIATYTCVTGYSLTGGPAQLTCEAGGVWSSVGFSCVIQDCGSPPSLTNAAAPSYTTTTYQSTATYTCDTGFALSAGTGQITCLAGSTWETATFTCDGQSCGAPPTVTNANPPVYTTTTYQSTASYTCSTGFTMSGGTAGTFLITCLDSSGLAWETPSFTCNLQDCGVPPTLTNGARTYPATTYQSTATYTCNTGYSLTGGTGQITCLLGAVWDSVTFSCVLQDCGVPPTLTNGARTYPATTYQSTATYTCNTGYSLTGGTGQITCQHGAVWGTVTFSCALQDCGSPPTLTNGVRSFSTTTYGSTATYACNSGYSLSAGTNPITCQSSGSWTTMSLSCIAVDCGSPPTLTNGARSFSTTTYGSTATYGCNSGYSLSAGTNPITCQSSGSWTTISISCIVVDCGSPPTLTNGARSFSTTTYGSTATYGCNSGYSLSAGTNPITCQSSGSWTTMSLSCSAVDCGSPPTLTNGARSFSTTTYGSKSTYGCNSGYSLSAGTNPITCQSSGSWTTMSLSCIVVDCGSPPTLTNGARSFSTTTYGSTATYGCYSGYSLSAGTNPITCQSSGSWTTMSLSCIVVDCGVPPTLTNGARSFSTTTYGSTATYACYTGYSISAGNNPITCQSSGSWTTMSLSCIAVDCGTPPTLSNGARTYSSTLYNNVATYTCNSGYSMDTGSSTITCQSTGSWSSITFSCVSDSNTLTPCIAAPGNGYMYLGKCYAMSSDAKRWSDAVAQCQSYNMHLVDITSSGESAHVKAMVHANPANVWIGGSDSVTEGSWVWAYTGAAFSYLDWWYNDPDGGTGQNCLGIWSTSYDSQWIDIGCSSSLRYICEPNF